MHTGLTEALLGYHPITGRDYVSCLFRKGQTTPFKRLIESTEHIQEMRTLTTNEVDDCQGRNIIYLFSVWTQHVSYK